MDHGVTATTWTVLAAMILVAKVGGELAIRLRQPAVLGEIVAGVLVGNLAPESLSRAAHGPEITFAAELGVMLLLFQVGLESSVARMVKVAPRAGIVAILGVVFPSAFGVGVSTLLLPGEPLAVHLFMGATLCATSIGITASVLKEVGALGTSEARIILGAAVIDDVLGLIVLAVVSGIAMTGTVPAALDVLRIMGAAFAFLVAALAIGFWVVRGAYRAAAVVRAPHVLGAVSVVACLLFSGAAITAGLAGIVGAYAAGLLLDDVSVRPFDDRAATGVHKVEVFVVPFVAVFGPVFFVRTGMNVKLGGLDANAALLIALLVVAAVAGKLLCGFGVSKARADRLTVGFGMLPRGEVGLIFADVGLRLAPGGKALLTGPVYAALVTTVLVTTVLAPPALSWRILSRKKSETVDPAGA